MHLFAGQIASNLDNNSRTSSEAAVKISLKGVPGEGLNFMKSGRPAIPFKKKKKRFEKGF